MAESKGLKKWRSKQKPGAIMKPGTFEAIKRKAAAGGARDAGKVAGKAYWKTAEAKYQQYLHKKYSRKRKGR